MYLSIKKNFLIAFSIFFINSVTFASEDLVEAYDPNVDIDGAKVGRWTMDFDAAKKLAKEKKLPILVNFTGSDWCGYCKIAERDVFKKEEWNEYAKDHVVMVYVDFPKRKKIPQKYKERNKDIKEGFGITGFPTFVILDEDGETMLSKFGVAKENTPDSFINTLENKWQLRNAELIKYTKDMDAKDREKYLKITRDYLKAQNDMRHTNIEISKLQKQVKKMQKNINEDMYPEIQLFRAAQMGDEKLAEYKKIKEELAEAIKDINAWFATRPRQTTKNNMLMKEKKKVIHDLQKQLESF
jgi:thioredoxin-related protein